MCMWRKRRTCVCCIVWLYERERVCVCVRPCGMKSSVRPVSDRDGIQWRRLKCEQANYTCTSMNIQHTIARAIPLCNGIRTPSNALCTHKQMGGQHSILWLLLRLLRANGTEFARSPMATPHSRYFPRCDSVKMTTECLILCMLFFVSPLSMLPSSSSLPSSSASAVVLAAVGVVVVAVADTYIYMLDQPVSSLFKPCQHNNDKKRFVSCLLPEYTYIHALVHMYICTNVYCCFHHTNPQKIEGTIETLGSSHSKSM